jgi:WD40 repeat protein
MNSFQDAFISYGRADSKAFALKLYQHLSDRDFKVWFDFENIPLGVDFQNQIDDGIEKADNFLFVIAPHSINSPYCGKEIELALKRHKRIIPLLHVEQISRDTWQQRYPQGTDAEWEAYQAKGLHSSFPNMHPEIGKINWVYFREGIDDFDQSFSGLLQLLERHKSYVHKHTYFLAKALEWEKHQQQSRYLLVGEERSSAQEWLKVHFKDEQPPCTPTDLHCEYITESIKSAHNLMTQVFLAYAHEDKAVMEKIRNSLRREGFTVWTNTTDIQTGETFEKAIQRGIEQADNIVYLLSPDALNSEYCQQELNYSLSLNKRIIPLQVRTTDPEQIPVVLRNLQYIDLTDNVKEEDYRLDENQLIKILHQEEAYYREHKVLLVKALNWQRQNQNPSTLLRGYNLRQSEAWLKTARHRPQHPPTSIQEEFITTSLQQPPASALDVFISYSRADGDLAHKLNDALQMQGKITWFDQESIPKDVDIQQEIAQGIETSDNVLFLLSPHAVNSPEFRNEVEHATSLNKRVVTVLNRAINPADLHPGLADVQWIDFNQSEADFATTFSQLIRTLDTDREHVQNHTKWLQRALEWEQKSKDNDLLLRGNDFAVAQAWLQTALEQSKQPAPTALQQTFIEESHKAITAAEEAEKQRQAELLRLQEERTKEAEARLLEEKKSAQRQKMFLGAVSVGFVVATGLGVLSFQMFRQAQQREREAKESTAVALTASSEALYKSNEKLDALVEALWAKEIIKDIKETNTSLKQAVDGVLQQAVFGVREYNRLSGPDGHQATVLAVAFSPNGQVMVSGGADDTIKLWNREGKLLKTLKEHQGSVNAVAFSPDGQQFASASVDKTIKLWNQDGTLLKTLTGHGDQVKAIAFSPDGTMIASGSDDKTIKLWNRDGTLLKTLTKQERKVKAVAFSPDSQQIATGGNDKTIKLWSRDGTLLKTLTGHTDEVEAVAFSPDGKLIASAADDRTVKLWKPDGTLLKTLAGHRALIKGVAFSPDGKTIASGSWDRTVKLWNLDGTLLATLAGHTDKVTNVVFSPDSQTIASTSDDNTIKLWKRDERLLKTLYRHRDIVNSVAFSSDGRLVASAGDDKTINLWKLDGTWKATLRGTDKLRNVVFSPDGQMIAAASRDKSIKIWKQDGTLLKTIPETDKVSQVAFSPDGKLIASASSDNTVKLWQLDGRLLTTLQGHSDDVNTVAFSPDGELIASGSSDNTVRLWNRSGQLVATLKDHKGPVNDVSFSLDGQMIVSGGVDNTIKLWNRQGKLLTTMSEHEDSINQVLFSPDGKKIASASADGTVKLWDADGKLLNTFTVHTDAVNGIAFSPDSQMVVSASSDTTALVWNVNQVLQPETLQPEACKFVQDYLKTNSGLEKFERSLCDNVAQ